MMWGKTKQQWYRDYCGDHRWFAWYPVKLRTGQWCWLQTIWYRGTGKGGNIYSISLPKSH